MSASSTAAAKKAATATSSKTGPKSAVAATAPRRPSSRVATARKTPAKAAPAAVAVLAAAAASQAAVEAKPAKADKHRKKLVRDSFTMPADDFALIAKLKERALNAKRPVKKSELLRAGLRALYALKVTDLVATLNALAPVKAGRPSKA
jgi:hypothetical protein